MSGESNLKLGYAVAHDLAVKRFGEANLQMVARLSRSTLHDDGHALSIAYLGKTFIVHWPSAEVECPETGAEIPITTKILILNYLLSSNGQQLSNRLISFRDIPGAATYEPSFNKRALSPMVKTFDGKPDALLQVADKLGGSTTDVAETGVIIPILPLLPITYGIWHGDEEFPGSGVILFDFSARKLLSAEFLVVAAANGVYEMIKLAKSIG